MSDQYRSTDHRAGSGTGADAETPRGHVAPRTAAERTVAEIWTALLGVEEVGALDDFFLLGGSSLLLTRLRTRLTETSGVDVELLALFAATTVETQAALLAPSRDRSSSGDGSVGRPRITPVERRPRPLGPGSGP